MVQKLKKNPKKRQPARIIVKSFFMVICIGTLLLMTPMATKAGVGTPFIEALFTATSATCVTGLAVFDTFTHWSVFGQLIILTMIQIGGIGLLTFTTFFNMAMGKKLGLRGMQLAQESMNSSSLVDIKQLIRMVIKLSIGFELAGAIVLAFTFVPLYGGEGLFISCFLAISAFCNAGFDILGREGVFCSLTHYVDQPAVVIPIMLLIIFGGLGFVVIHDLMNYHKTHRLMFHSRIVLTMNAILWVVGFLIFFLFEWKNPATLGPLSLKGRILAVLFQSVTLRSAGYNTINIPKMHEITKLLSVVLMFIGGAPGSTGGGIKVTTFAVIVMTVICVVKGYQDTIMQKRRVSKNVVYKALTVISIALLAIFLTASMITVVTNKNAEVVTGIDAIFESVSAFSTCGLSAGVTEIAGPIVRLLLIFTMFLGRVGPVSLALSFAMRPNTSRKEIIPEGKIMVG